MNTYKDWCYRLVTRTQCNPGIVAVLFLAALLVVVWRYASVILHTLLVAAISTGAAFAMLCGIFLTVSIVRWRRRLSAQRAVPLVRAKPVATAVATPPPALPDTMPPRSPVPATDEQAMTGDAATLADENVVLEWSSDGRTLTARTK